MKITRKAVAEWNGSGKEGKGKLTTDSKTLDGTQYGYKSRFESGIGTNPEELIGAAHAGCYSMKLAFNLQEAGFEAENIKTESKVTLGNDGIKEVDLDTKVKVSGIGQDQFNELAEDAKENCPISQLLKAKINFTSSLES